MALPAWIGQIAASLFKAGLNFLKDWYEGEKSKENEWNAKTREAQLRSVKDEAKMRLKIKNAKPIKVSNPSGWNAGAKLILIGILLVPLTGCGLFTKYIHVEAKMPVIDAPARPRIPDQPLTWTPREIILKDYALDLEAKVTAYNKIAHEMNVKNGYEDPAPSTP